MINRSFRLLVIFFFSATLSFGQRLNKADRTLLTKLRTHVSFLSDDKLEGRRAGTKGEKLAREYISAEFNKTGLQPKGDNGSWYQPFDIYDGKRVDPSTHLIINGNDLKLNKDYFPFTFSARSGTEAAVAMALAERGVPWFYELKELLEENKDNPHFDLPDAIREKANKAADKGASALIVFNTSEKKDNLQFNSRDRSEIAKIPVLYISKETKSKYFGDESSTVDMKLKVAISDKSRQGNNVVGYIDNGADNTVILGAHYDHLGFGEDGNSMLRNGPEAIHNGADDNASGTAALIELARLLKQSKNKSANFMFIAFSGEELGLNGSKYFTENPTVPLEKISYMINMDMIGRLNESSKALTIGGYGTSPLWGIALPSIKDGRNFTIKFDSSGTGPSDHNSFYRKEIPVLFFFTGLHGDYHKPSDDFDKINYIGQLQIVKYISQVIEKTSKNGKPVFAKTQELQTSTNARFNVGLGIMPDYTFSGSGIKVDATSTGRAAEKAGMKTGDIIIQLGEHNTSSMETYMQALSKYKKGDKTRVKFKRGEETLVADVEF